MIEQLNYDILTGRHWPSKSISYGFDPNVPINVQQAFRAVADEITGMSSLTLTEESSPEIQISLRNIPGYLDLTFLPGSEETNGDVWLSQKVVYFPRKAQNLIARHSFGHALGLGDEYQYPDSIMAVTIFPKAGVTNTDYTPYDWWAIEETYRNVF